MGTVMLPCGTYAAYQRHYRAGETCAPCKAAASVYLKDKYRRRREKYGTEHYNAKEREARHRRKTADPERERARQRRNTLKYNYGLTGAEWDKLFQNQGRKCRCCGTDSPGAKAGWATDHDHVTGEIRGIVCHLCNRLLGHMGDNLESVQNAFERFVKYLTTKAPL